jgi:hypothetical protein
VVHALTDMILGDRGTLMITSGQHARSVVAPCSTLAGVSVARSVSRQTGALNARRYVATAGVLVWL